MMRRLERGPVVEFLTGDEFPTQRTHRGDLERLGIGERREDARQTLREQGLPGPRCPSHEEVVSPGGRDLDPEARLLLTLHLGEVVEFRCRRRRTRRFDDGRELGNGEGPAVDVDEFGQRRHRPHVGCSQQCRLGAVAGGHDEALESGEQPGVEDGQHPADGSDPAVKSEFPAVDDCLRVRRRDDSAGSEHGHGDAKVESGADLRHAARREVDRQVLSGHRQAQECECRAQPLARFAHRGVGQPDDVDARQAGADDRFDGDDPAGQTPQGHGRSPADDGGFRFDDRPDLDRLPGVDRLHDRLVVRDDPQMIAHESTCTFLTWVTNGRGDMTMPIASMRVVGKNSD